MLENNDQNENDLTAQTKSALITGGNGLLARFMRERLMALGWRAVAPTHAELDTTREDDVMRFIERERPDFVINCATT
ncbi:MAG TPA: sugar nucleotide-binding protein, partial [Blastocatellia bacterium]|nr:sugar nucleotide-binding protein [Blastocatellia bacterium]